MLFPPKTGNACLRTQASMWVTVYQSVVTVCENINVKWKQTKKNTLERVHDLLLFLCSPWMISTVLKMTQKLFKIWGNKACLRADRSHISLKHCFFDTGVTLKELKTTAIMINKSTTCNTFMLHPTVKSTLLVLGNTISDNKQIRTCWPISIFFPKS